MPPHKNDFVHLELPYQISELSTLYERSRYLLIFPPCEVPVLLPEAPLYPLLSFRPLPSKRVVSADICVMAGNFTLAALASKYLSPL